MGEAAAGLFGDLEAAAFFLAAFRPWFSAATADLLPVALLGYAGAEILMS